MGIAGEMRRAGEIGAVSDGPTDRARFCPAPREQTKRWLTTRWAKAEEETGMECFMRQNRAAERAPGVAVSRCARG